MNEIIVNFVKNNVMGAEELKKELHSYIDQADEAFLKMVYAMSREYKKLDIVGYNTDGSPITQKDLRKRVKAASKRVKAGHYTTQEEVEKEIENW
jgi:predicted ribonuclease YlaK